MLSRSLACVPLFCCLACSGTNNRQVEYCDPLPSNELSDEERACLVVQSANAYLDRIQTTVVEAWQIPRGAWPNQCVVVRFSIDSDGNLTRDPEVLSSVSGRMRKSILRALTESAPFGSVPEDARCLTEVRFLGKFTNPPVTDSTQ
jgi:hypothetical protein